MGYTRGFGESIINYFYVPEFQSITGALNKILAYNLMRLTKSDGGTLANDTEECYNRIVPWHAMLCCCQMGLLKTAAKMLTTILINTIYKLKSGHRMSTCHYTSSVT